jgi:hypothetical protein
MKKKEPNVMSDPISLYQLLNQSKRVQDDAFGAIAHALGIQLARDVAPVYGTTPGVTFDPGVSVVDPKQVTPVIIVDTPDVDGALGYHDTDDQGNPFVKVFVNPILDNGGSITSGSNSLSVTISHELLETLADAGANVWADGPEGFDYAYELCDPVESDSYDIEGVSVSNFVYPAYFQPKFKGRTDLKYDQMGTVKDPLTMTAGGYLIQRTEPGQVTNIFTSRRGSVQVDHGIVLSYGPTFPSWKRPYKFRKALAMARHNYFRIHGKYPGKAGT